MSNTVKFIFCDIGGVLFDEGGTDALQTKLEIDIQKFKLAKRKYFAASILGEITPNQYIESVLRDIGSSIKITDYNDFWTAHSKPFPIGHEMLTTLSRHFPIGLLTNNMKNSIPYYEKYDHIPKLDYKTIIESSALGVKKPDRRIYEIAEHESGYRGNEIYFIDDRENNIESAKKMGWKTALYDTKNQMQSSKKILDELLNS